MRFFVLYFVVTAFTPLYAAEKQLTTEDHSVIYRNLVDLVGDVRTDVRKMAAGFGISVQELREQTHLKSLGEKLQLLIEVFAAAEDALKVKTEKKITLGSTDLTEKESRSLQRRLNLLLKGVYQKLEKLSQKYDMTLQEFRNKLTQKEALELFDYLIDAIELGQDGPKLEKKALHFKVLENIPWRIKTDEADELYYTIKPVAEKYYDAVEAHYRSLRVLSDEDYLKQEIKNNEKLAELKENLRRKIVRHCAAFKQIDPYLKRRGQSCGTKCKPIPVCTEIGW